MMFCLLAWQTGIQVLGFISGQLVPLADRWLAPGNGYHIVSDACRPHREVDVFAGWMADEVVYEAVSSS